MRPMIIAALLSLFTAFIPTLESEEADSGIPLFFWQHKDFMNFGDYISLKLVERVVGESVKVVPSQYKQSQKLLAIGSILYFASENDVLWGTGFNGKDSDFSKYRFKNLDVRAVRGPITRSILINRFGIDCPEVYGDPALLFPYFFPEFQKPEHPLIDYIIIPHYSERVMFPKDAQGHIVYPTDPWDEVIQQIVNSAFVISSSLHGIVIAEAYGIPARLLKVTNKEPLTKYEDYYLGTNRPDFKYAISVEEALQMGGEPPFICDLKQLYETFPMEYWTDNYLKPIQENEK